MNSDDLNSFQNGVDTIYNKCVELGSTPIENTPDSIADAITYIYNNGYNDGSLSYKIGTFETSSTSTTYTIDLGFNPSKLSLLNKQNNSSYTFIIYNSDIESGYFYQAVSGGTVARPNITSNTSNNRLRLIENGFTLKPCLSGTWHYFALE